MASNQYRTQGQRQPLPSNRYHGQEYSGGSVQNALPNRGGGYAQPDVRMYQEPYQDPYAGQNGYYDDQQYDQHGRWEEQQYQDEEPYQGQPHGYHSGPQYDQRPPPPQSSRSYQYDERFHGQGQTRGQPAHGNGGGRARRSEDGHRLNNLPLERKPKPRERILTAPSSPKEIGWDNPFPTFNTKKKEDKKKHTSLDKGLGKLNLGDPYPKEARPQTSQGHTQRHGGDSRPSTSHAQRPPDPERIRSPPLQQSAQMPLRKAPPPSRAAPPPTEPYGADDPTQRYRAGGNPSQHPMGSSQSSTSFRSQPGQPPQNSRSPISPQGRMFENGSQRLPAKDEHWQEPGAVGGYVGGEPNEYSDPNYNYQRKERPQNQQARSYGTPHSSEQTNASRPQGYTGGPNGNDQQRRPGGTRIQTSGPNFAPQQNEMPNFEAIPQSVSEMEKMHLQSGQHTPVEQPAYQKKTYQAPEAYHGTDHQAKKPHPQGYTNGSAQSPLADFAFDLPSSRSHGPTNLPPTGPSGESPALLARSQPFTNAYVNHMTRERRNPWNEPIPGTDKMVEPQGSQAIGHFPPRGASRPDPQPRSANDAQQHPLPGNQRSQPVRTDRFHQMRQNTSQGAYGQDPEHDQDYGQSQYREDYDYGYDQQPGPAPQDYPGARQYPASGNDIQRQYSHSPPQPTAYDSMQPRRPQQPNPARPPPVRIYGDRSSSDSLQRQHGRQASFGSPANPDLLPAHPVPFRPGLMNNSELARAETPQSQAPPSQHRGPSGPRPTSKPAETPVTIPELNDLQARVKANPSDFATGLKFAKTLVRAAKDLSSDNGRADAKTTAKNRERYIMDAHKVVKKLVAAGYTDAMFYLADCHGQGLLGLAPDPKEAFQLYQSAAKLGHPQAAYRVAVCCEIGADEGGGTRRDPLKAIQWYKRAATLGDTPAMYKMGMIQLKGLLGQPKNPREAMSWLKRAADRADEENPHALHELGLLHENSAPNSHIIKDPAYALQLFTQAAELGYKYSQFRLGVVYEYGLLGIPEPDNRASIAWYSRAAAQGEHQSELALSGWYLTGAEPIVTQSDTEAYLWARKAAMSGLAKAEFAMGYYCETGIGIARNIEDAKRWYWKAAAQQHPKAQERLEQLRRGAQAQQKTRVSRGAVRDGGGECSVM